MTKFDTLASTAGCELARFCADESGGTAIEYAMLASGVGACIAATIWSFGGHLKTTFYDKLAALFP